MCIPEKMFYVRGEPGANNASARSISVRLERPNGFVRHYNCSSFAGFRHAEDCGFCQYLTNRVKRPSPDRHEPTDYRGLRATGWHHPRITADSASHGTTRPTD